MDHVNIELSGIAPRQSRRSVAEYEVEELRRELAAAQQTLRDHIAVQRTIDRELVELRALLKEAERQLTNVRRTLAFQLGQVVMQVDTLKGLLAAPLRIYRIVRAYRAKRAIGQVGKPHRPSERMRYVAETLGQLEQNGSEAALAHVRSLPDRHRSAKVRALTELALTLRAADPVRAGEIGCEAAVRDPAEPQLRTLAFALYDDGHVRLPFQVLERMSADVLTTQAQRARAAAIRADRRELDMPFAFSRRAQAPTAGNTVAVIAARSLPSHADAASYRAQAVASAAIAGGTAAVIMTEPGYRYPSKGDGSSQRVTTDEGIALLRLAPLRAETGDLGDSIAQTAGLIEQELRRCSAGSVHIVADAPLALAAAEAAARCGLGYTLDIGAIPLAGGLGRPGWIGSERFAAMWSRLATLARDADQVIARSATLAHMLREHGIRNVSVRPDALPPSIVPASPAMQHDIRRELGVAGAQPLIGMIAEVDQEGRLLDLIRVMPRVRAQVPDAMLVFCGSGRIGQAVRHEAALLGMSEGVLVPDGFVRQRLAHYVSTFDVMLFGAQHNEPGLAAPFELQVAAALGTPVVAIDCAWASDVVAPASLVVPGDEAALIAALVAALNAAAAKEASR